MDKTLQKVTLAKLASLLNEGTPWPFEGQVVQIEAAFQAAIEDGDQSLVDDDEDNPDPCPDACEQCSARINGEE